MTVYLEIVGLNEMNYGRICNVHTQGCGKIVTTGTLLILQPTVIETDTGREYAIAAICADGNIRTCTVGYIAKEYLFFKMRYENKYAQVVELLEYSRNTEHQKRSKINHGIAKCVLLE